MKEPVIEPFAHGGYRIRIGIDVLGYRDTREQAELFLGWAQSFPKLQSFLDSPWTQ